MLVKGKSQWCKLLGEPIRNDAYPENPRAWTIDLCVDKEQLEVLKEAGLYGKVKNKGDSRGEFITFKRKEFKSDGVTRNQPVKIVDHHGNAWKKDIMIGNGSEIYVRFNVYQDRRGAPNPAILAVQVWRLEPYIPKTRDDDFPIHPGENPPEVEEMI